MRCESDFVLIPTHFYHATTLQLRDFIKNFKNVFTTMICTKI